MEISADGSPAISDASDEFTDGVIVLPSGTRFRVHRVIVSSRSPFLASAFKRAWQSGGSSANEIHLSLQPAVESYFPLLIRYLYGSKVAINAANAVPLLTLADVLLIKALHAQAMSYIAVAVHSSAADLSGVMASADALGSELVLDLCLAAASDERSGWPLLLAASNSELADVSLSLWLLILERVAQRTVRGLRAAASNAAVQQLLARATASSPATRAAQHAPSSGTSTEVALALMLPSQLAAMRRTGSSGGSAYSSHSAFATPSSLAAGSGAGAAIISAAVARHLLASGAGPGSLPPGVAAAAGAAAPLTADAAMAGRTRWALQALLRTAGPHAAAGVGVGGGSSSSSTALEPLWFGTAANAPPSAGADEGHSTTGAAHAHAHARAGPSTGAAALAASAEAQRRWRAEEARLLSRRRDLSALLLRLLRSFLSSPGGDEAQALDAGAEADAALDAAEAAVFAAAGAAADGSASSAAPAAAPALLLATRRTLYWLQSMSPLLETAAAVPVLNGTAAWALARTAAGSIIADALAAQFGGEPPIALHNPAAATGTGASSSSAGAGAGGLRSLGARRHSPWVSEGRRLAWLRESLPELVSLHVALAALAPVAASAFASAALRSQAQIAILRCAALCGFPVLDAAALISGRFGPTSSAGGRRRFSAAAAPSGGAGAASEAAAAARAPIADGDAGVAADAAGLALSPVTGDAPVDDAASALPLSSDEGADADADAAAHGGTAGAAGVAGSQARAFFESPLPAGVERDSVDGLRAVACCAALADFALGAIAADELRVEHEDDAAAFALDTICDLWASSAGVAGAEDAAAAAAAAPGVHAGAPPPARTSAGAASGAGAVSGSARWRAFGEERARAMTRSLWQAVRWEYTSDAALIAGASAVLALRHARRAHAAAPSAAGQPATAAAPAPAAAAPPAAVPSVGTAPAASTTTGGIVGGRGTADSPFVATDDGDSWSLPVPAGPFTRLLLLHDRQGDRPPGATGNEIVLLASGGAAAGSAADGSSGGNFTPGGAAAVGGGESDRPSVPGDADATADAACDADGDGGAEDPFGIGVSDADLENARYRHRLAGLVATPAAAVAIGLLPPRLSYASRNRPLLPGPGGFSPTSASAAATAMTLHASHGSHGAASRHGGAGSPEHRDGSLSGHGHGAAGRGTILRALPGRRTAGLLPDAPAAGSGGNGGDGSGSSGGGVLGFPSPSSGPSLARPGSMRRLQQDGPLAVLQEQPRQSPVQEEGNDAAVTAAAFSFAADASPATSPAAAASSAPATGGSVVFGRHAVAFPDAASAGGRHGGLPLLTNWPQNERTAGAGASAAAAAAPSSAASSAAANLASGRAARLLRVQARAAAAAAASEDEPGHDALRTPLLLPAVPFSALGLPHEEELAAFSLQASSAGSDADSSSAAAGGAPRDA